MNFKFNPSAPSYTPRSSPGLHDDCMLHDAAAQGHTALVASILRNPGINPNLANQDGYTALMIAALEGHAPVMTLLLADERVDPNMTNQQGLAALIFAAENGHAPVVALLEESSYLPTSE